jgi:hypothetical protein
MARSEAHARKFCFPNTPRVGLCSSRSRHRLTALSQDCRDQASHSKDGWSGRRWADVLVELGCEEAFSGPPEALLTGSWYASAGLPDEQLSHAEAISDRFRARIFEL